MEEVVEAENIGARQCFHGGASGIRVAAYQPFVSCLVASHQQLKIMGQSAFRDST